MEELNMTHWVNNDIILCMPLFSTIKIWITVQQLHIFCMLTNNAHIMIIIFVCTDFAEF